MHTDDKYSDKIVEHQPRVSPKAFPMVQTAASQPLNVEHLPGHAIRRLHQIAVGIFHQELQELNLTPVQFAALQTVANQPGLDQRTLAGLIALDTSTTASLLDRLEARGLLRRSLSPTDKRVRLLSLTEEGQAVCLAAQPGVKRAQKQILAPLNAAQRQTFMELLAVLVTENHEFSRAWSDDTRKG